MVDSTAKRIKIQMSPDYGNTLFWDEEGCSIGDCETIWLGDDNYNIEIDLSSVKGLKQWFHEWELETLSQTHHWTDSQWREWWEKGVLFANEVNKLLPDNVYLDYFSLKYPLWKIKPEDTDDGGLFNYGDPITLLKAGEYIFECFIMSSTECELGPECKYNGNNPIKVQLQLSYIDIQAIVDMINWSWDNFWMDQSTSETVFTELLKTRLPHIYNRVQPIAHEMFCASYPNSEHIKGFGIYEIFCPDEIVDYSGYSRKDYYLK